MRRNACLFLNPTIRISEKPAPDCQGKHDQPCQFLHAVHKHFLLGKLNEAEVDDFTSPIQH